MKCHPERAAVGGNKWRATEGPGGGGKLRVTLITLLLLTGLTLACAPAATEPSGGPATEGDAKSRWDQTLAAAKREGKVSVVTHTNLHYREIVNKFAEKYPDIQMEHVAMRPSEFAPKVITEQQNGIFGYDTWISSTSNMVELVVPAGGFQPITPFLILPEVTDPSNWRGNQLLYATKEPLILLNRGNLSGDVWVNRSKLSKSEFSSMDQVLDPKFKGQIQIRTPNAPHNASLTFTGIYRAKGEDFLSKLMTDQQPQYIENARLLTQNLIQGKTPLAFGIDQATIDQCQEAGGCKDIEEVKGYPHLLGHGGGVLKNAPHPAAAAVFLNWFFSKEGQEVWKQAIMANTPAPHQDAHSSRKDVEPGPGAVQNKMVPDYDNLKQYSLQGMEQGAEDMQAVLNLYKKVEAGGRR